MKKLFIILTWAFVISACDSNKDFVVSSNNENPDQTVSTSKIQNNLAQPNIRLVQVCHNNKIISVDRNAVDSFSRRGTAVDRDGDGYFDKENNCVDNGFDCDDLNPNVNPGSVEICGNKIDDNCNKQIDEGCSFEINLNISGRGKVILDPHLDFYEFGTEVTLKAVAIPEWEFVEWGGDLQGTLNPQKIVVNADKNIAASFFTLRDKGTAVVDVTNPITGRTWMDRNLGAGRAALTFNDVHAYGHLYQWGRHADGHQTKNRYVYPILARSEQPGHPYFIASSRGVWLSSNTNNLWQGLDGMNNPCPAGYRIPTVQEWEEERDSWSSRNSAGAYNSPLKLTGAGNREATTGTSFGNNNRGLYWSSDVAQEYYNRSDAYTYARYILIGSNSHINILPRGAGLSVRCIKD